jgi:hypothetical protein
MAKYCKLCGEPMSLHDELDDPLALEPRRQAVANRTRRDARLARVTASVRACPVVPVERDGRTVWIPRRLAGNGSE